MILVDTSAWIEFFRGRGSTASLIDSALETNEVALCGPVVTELRRGFRSAAERRRTLPLFDGCHQLTPPPGLWEEAGDLGFLLARRGATVKTLDLLIASYALFHGVSLLTTDRDFEVMRKAGIPLLLVRS